MTADSASTGEEVGESLGSRRLGETDDPKPWRERFPRKESGAAFLYPGHIFTSATGESAITILGSCVSVCLWDEATEIGGLNHFILPDGDVPNGEDGRYGIESIDLLISELRKLGAKPGRLTAKVFGGACVLNSSKVNSRFHVGKRNVDVAMEYLLKHRIPVRSSDVGGSRGRKIVFETDNGAAWVRSL